MAHYKTETSPLLSDKHSSQQAYATTKKETKDDLLKADKASLSSSTDTERGDEQDDDDNDTVVNDRPEVNMNLLLPSVAIGIILSAADQTLIVSSFGKIGSDLKALNNISWIATAYYLTLTSFSPLYGKLCDIFGRRTTLLFAYAVFGSGCIACGLAQNMEQLVAARAFAGIGAGGMTTVVSILVGDYVELKDRGLWQGYINIIWCIGGSSGAPLGGIFSETIGWRWLFLVQGPLCAVACISVLFVLPADRPSTLTWHQKFRRVDILGALTLVAAVFSLLLGLDRGSNVGWNDVWTISCCALVIPLFTLFAYVEMKVAAYPFAPGHIVLGRNLLPAYLVNFFVFAAYVSNQFYVPLYLQAVHALTPSQVGVRMIWPIVLAVSTSLACGRVMQATGKYYWLTILTCTVMIPGVLLVLFFSGIVACMPWVVVAGTILSGFAQGGSVTTTLIATIANSDPADQAIATASTYLFRALGSIVGIGMASTATQQVLRTRLRASLPNGEDADQIVLKVRESLEYLKTLDPATREIVIRCYQKATSSAFSISVVTAVLGLTSAFFIREAKLRR